MSAVGGGPGYTDLRRRAEEAAGEEKPVPRELSIGELEHLVHELEVQQHELQLMNEELHRTKAELESARDRYFALYEAAPVGYLTLNREGLILQANLTAATLLRTERRNLQRRPLARLMNEQDASRFTLFMRSAFAASGRRSLEVTLHRGDGPQMPVLLEAVAVAPEEELRVALIDLTERRRSEQIVADREATMRAILDAAIDGIFTVDEHGHLRSFNAQAERIFGYADDDVIGRPLGLIIPGETASLGHTRELAGRHKEGRSLVLELGLTEVKVLGTRHRVGVVRDITERKQRDEQLRQSQRLEAVGTLASGIAHDFNNLLMGIAGATQLALRSLPPEHPSYAAVRRALGATMRGSSLTRQLLRFTDTRKSLEQTLELDAAVEGARDMLASLLGEHIRLVFAPGAPGRHLRADPGDIEQILMNLAANARDAMEGGGTLTVRTREVPGPNRRPQLALVVTDTGSGMDRATRERIFEPFFTTKPVGQGTGLGLTTVFTVVRRLDGRVEVESEPGQGTTFTILLPGANGGHATPAPGSRAAESRPSPRGSETVLLVEDDPLVRATVRAYLETLGYRPLVVAGPEEALALSLDPRQRIDLLLTDVMMPGLLGKDLARQIRQRRPTLPVLFMSAHPHAELLRLGRLDAEDPLLGKPFEEEALGLEVRRALERRPAPQAPQDLRVLVVDDNQDVADTLADALAADDGRKIGVARDGAQAITLGHELRPQVLFCDLELGGEPSGYDVARALRADQHLAGALFVALTGHAREDCLAPAREAGFDDVLTKPVDLDTLNRLIERRGH